MHMYAQHFNLNLLPFENVPDPLFFYDHGDHARIRKQISGSLQSGRGLIVVAGPMGSGKTTLSQMIKADFPDNVQVIWMAEPPANSSDLYLFLAQELGIHPSSAEKTFVMRDIRNALITINTEGKKCLVIVDESHLMSEDVINGIRLLNNLEEGSIKLIQLLLLGQDELLEIINKPEMAPFKQRIAALEILGRMNVDGVLKYITHRLQIAGGNSLLISENGWEALSIAFKGGGTPRTINSLCDRAFNVAFERNKHIVDAHDIYEATQRMGLVTDVFHYIIMLNNQERMKQDSQPMTAERETTASETIPKTEPVSAAKSKPNKPEQDTASIFSETQSEQSIKSYDEIAKTIKAKYERKNLKLPLLVLLISIVTLAGSMIFFCHQTSSEGLSDCLRLISFKV